MMIRKATVADAPALDHLVNSAYRGDSAKKGWTHEADLLGGIRTNQKQLEKMLADEQLTLLVLENNGLLDACVCLENKGNKMYLGMLTVNPEKQGGGLGKLLLTASEAEAKAQEKKAIEMTVISIRKELIDYYLRRGYQHTGERRPFPMDDPEFGEPKTFLEFVVLEKKIA